MPPTPNVALRVAGVVREVMDTAGISQREMSAATGIPLPTLNRRLAGHQPLNLVELDAIARRLGLTVTEIAARADRVPITHA